MEKLENNIENNDSKIKDQLNKLEEEILPWTNDIRQTISALKSFNELPIKISYKNNVESNKLPKTLDMRPKPFWDKWENIDWKISEKPDYLLISLDNRKFKIIPELWKIDNITIKEWSVILEIKVWFLWKDEKYDSDRMTKLLILLRTHTSGYNKDIYWTPRASVKEEK